MFRHMLKENPKVKKGLEDKGLNSDWQTFIEELIKGEPYEKDRVPQQVSVLLHFDSRGTSCFVISSQSVHTGIMAYIWGSNGIGVMLTV